MKKNNNKDKIQKPFSVWDEMAETDILIEYMRRFVDSKDTMPDIYASMMDSLYSYSTEFIPEVEQYYSEKLYTTLKYFLDKVTLCQNQKQ